MVEFFERRVTRGLSSDLQARAAAAQQAQQIAHQQQTVSSIIPQKTHNSSGTAVVDNKTFVDEGNSDSFSFEPLQYLRATSDEMLIRSFVDGVITQSTPSMADLGLSSLPLASTKNSEELFSCLFCNSFDVTNIAGAQYCQTSNRTPHGSNSSHPVQVITSDLKTRKHDTEDQNACKPSETAGNQFRPCHEEKQAAASHDTIMQNLPWFQVKAQPMTRSQSAELRCRYAAMHGLCFSQAHDTVQKRVNQDMPALDKGVVLLSEFAQANSHMRDGGQPSNALSASDPSKYPLSNMMTMFKDNLECKASIGSKGASDVFCSAFAKIVSPSESSIGAPNLSAGGSVDQPSIKLTQSLKLPCSKPKTHALFFAGFAQDNSNPTKIRRVERREKMLEAKGRPGLPSDLQVVLKHCDLLEKEARSLKLTVSFMNRKDSEQTKKIEELEKENMELQREKARLLQEVERLASFRFKL